MSFSGSYLAKLAESEVISGQCPDYFDFVTLDSRQADAGALFIALAGEHSDGHDYALAAVAQGATAVLGSDRDALLNTVESCTNSETCIMWVPDVQAALHELCAYWREDYEGTVIGITGSSGKTSTKELLAQVLSTQYTVSATKGNQNNELGVPLTMLNANPRAHYLIVEMGMRGIGQIAELCKLARPHIGVITSVGPSHIELLGSVELIARAKAELLEALPSDGRGFFSKDSEWAQLLTQLSHAPVYTVGKDSTDADLRVRNVVLDDAGHASAEISAMGHQFDVKLGVAGMHQLANALLVIAVALHEDVSIEHLVHALAHIENIEGRFKIQTNLAQSITVIDDTYNANPLSMRAALETLRALTNPGRKVAILGDMLELGDDSATFHESIGDLVCESGVSLLITYGSASKSIAQQAVDTCSMQVMQYERDEYERLQKAVEDELQEGDVVLVKGSRTMKLERIVKALVNNDVD